MATYSTQSSSEPPSFGSPLPHGGSKGILPKIKLDPSTQLNLSVLSRSTLEALSRSPIQAFVSEDSKSSVATVLRSSIASFVKNIEIWYCCDVWIFLFVSRTKKLPPQYKELQKQQKQSSRGVLKKKCTENMQQIYRRAPMPKCTLRHECSLVLTYECTHDVAFQTLLKVVIARTFSWIFQLWRSFDLILDWNRVLGLVHQFRTFLWFFKY